jgi:D-alanine-D-alanine ligase-like ATP-grasp enzyme
MGSAQVLRWVIEVLQCFYRVRVLINRRQGGMLAFSRSRSTFYGRIWNEAAKEIGASCIKVGDGVYEVGFRGKKTRVFETYTEIDDPVTLLVAGNKPVVLSILQREGISVPKFGECDIQDIESAKKIVQRMGKKCVLKPANGTGAGLAVTAGIEATWDLLKAAALASIFGRRILVEELIRGDVYRLLYLHGELLDAVVRKPPTVTGDGRSSIKALVEQENALRVEKGSERAQCPLKIDLDMTNCLREQNLSLASVPGDGEIVRVKTVVNENRGCENESATEVLSKSIIIEGARAANVIGAKMAGVDIITCDPSVPLSESGGAVIEVNTTPGYYYHYMKRDKPFPVAIYVLKEVFGLRDSGNVGGD